MMKPEEKEKALQIYEDWHIAKSFEIEDKRFNVTNMNHEFRVRDYALYSQIEDPKFKALFKEVENKILSDDMQISKIPNFWEDNEDIYLDFIQISLKLISYPFFRLKKKATN